MSIITSLNIQQIKEYLPHRFPLLLVDRVSEWNSGEDIKTIKNVTANEEFFNGHFPHSPVMPGVLIIEALAQTAALLCFLTAGYKPDANTMVYFAGIDRVRFKRPVEPGDQLMMYAQILRHRQDIWKFGTEATVDGELAVRGELICTIRDFNHVKRNT